MKRKLIFLSIITASFSSYASDILFLQQPVNTQDQRLKGINKYHDESGTNIIIDKDNNKNTTASIINYKNYSDVNKLPFNISDGDKPVININATNNKGISHTVFKQMDIGKKGVYLNNHNSVTPASIIVTEVNGNKMTNLVGKLDILGKEAALIVANPNGIECSGCGFSGIKELTLLAGKINFNKIGDLLLTTKKDKATIFSGNIDFTNVNTINIVTDKYKGTSDANVTANKIVYRISNMQYGINYNNIDDRATHFDFGRYGPFIHSFKGAEFNNQENSVISAKDISMYISAGSFNNQGTIDNQGLFYFDVYGSEDFRYTNAGNIVTNNFVVGVNPNGIENRGNGQLNIKYEKVNNKF